ncbi:MAG: hypothetical protein J7L88_00170 [Thermoplasmata archaeon]|nr:hypothetical protein [Thermoplasmata archaeon]
MEVKCPQCKNILTPPFDRCWICGWEAKGEEKRRAKKLYEQWMIEKFGKKVDEGEKKKRRKGRGMREEEVSFIPKGTRRRTQKPRRRPREAIIEEEEIPEAIIEEEPPRGRVEEEEEEIIPVKCKCGYTINIKVWEGMKEVVFRCPKCGREGKIVLEEEEGEEEEVGEEEEFEEEVVETPRRKRGGRYREVEEAPRRRKRAAVDLLEEEEEDIEELTFKRPPATREVRHETKFTVSPRETTEGKVKRCPVCGGKLIWKDNLELWYCPRCKEYY